MARLNSRILPYFLAAIALGVAVFLFMRSRPAVGQIGYSSTISGNADIYLIQADGSDIRQLTSGEQDEWLNDWSPDGCQLVFHVGTEGRGELELYTMNMNGTNRKQLTQNDSDDGLADWSPDGTQIVFASNRDGNYEIYSMNVDGTDQRRLTYTDANEYGPKWSPDGAEIIFDSVAIRATSRKIYLMNSDGSNVRRLTNSDDEVNEADPNWSPDGANIIFAQDLQIAIAGLDGDVASVLTSGGPVKISPSVSPDGRFIAFLNNDTPGALMGVWTMNSDGSNQRLVSNTDSPEDGSYYARWLPPNGCSEQSAAP